MKTTGQEIVDANQWIAKCAARLQQQWPRVEPDDLHDLACDLFGTKKWRAMPPEEAALEWLRQGIPEAA